MQTHLRGLKSVPAEADGNGSEDGTGTSTWQIFSRRRMAGVVVRHISVVAVVGVLLLSGGLGIHLFGAFAHSPCSNGDQVYVVEGGNTLGGIAARFNTSWQKLASYNHIANPNLIYINQTMCIPGKHVVHSGPPPVRG